MTYNLIAKSNAKQIRILKWIKLDLRYGFILQRYTFMTIIMRDKFPI